MNDLEDRLRATLHQAADTVPPSPHARAGFERRLGQRRGRGLVLAAAAAVVVIAGVAVPVALNQDDGPTGGRTATAPPTTSPATTPSGDLTLSVLDEFTEGGVRWQAVLTVVPARDGGEQVCVGKVGPDGEEPSSPECERVPATWPVDFGPDSGPGMVVLTRSVLGGDALYSGPLPNLLLFITAPQVTDLEVREAYGAPVRVDEVAKAAGATVYVAYFPETHAGFGYTAKDAAGNVLANAIT
jgi:hypothetical protein